MFQTLSYKLRFVSETSPFSHQAKRLRATTFVVVLIGAAALLVLVLALAWLDSLVVERYREAALVARNRVLGRAAEAGLISRAEAELA